MHAAWTKLLQREMYVAKERAEREERRKRTRGGIEKKEEDKDEEDALVFDPLDVASVMAEAGLVCACLDTIRADGEDYCCVPVPWRECLPKGILQCPEPQVVAYLRAWKRANARNEAYVRGGLAEAPSGEKKMEAWERRAEAAGQRARCRLLGLTSEWLQSSSASSSESSDSSSSSSSSDDNDE